MIRLVPFSSFFHPPSSIFDSSIVRLYPQFPFIGYLSPIAHFAHRTFLSQSTNFPIYRFPCCIRSRRPCALQGRRYRVFFSVRKGIRSSQKSIIFYSKLFQMQIGGRIRIGFDPVAQCRKSPLNSTKMAHFPKSLFPIPVYRIPITNPFSLLSTLFSLLSFPIWPDIYSSLGFRRYP